MKFKFASELDVQIYKDDLHDILDCNIIPSLDDFEEIHIVIDKIIDTYLIDKDEGIYKITIFGTIIPYQDCYGEWDSKHEIDYLNIVKYGTEENKDEIFKFD